MDQLISIEQKINEIRGQRVMLDFDLAEMYQVETKVLNQSVKRNIGRFPTDFMFQLTREEYNSLRSQFVTLETGRGKYSKYEPFAFTEHGAFALSFVLKSEIAVEVSIRIIRVFVAVRQSLMNNNSTSKEIAELREIIIQIQEDMEILNQSQENA
ncbi:hypothetical protein EZS27_039790, partial [termite gut metagenome]